MNPESEKEKIETEIQAIEARMGEADFWANKETAQATIKLLQELKEKKEGVGKYDKGNAIVTILSGAGGDDAEDFSAMLLNMYMKFIQKKGWGISFIHQHPNDHGGYRNISFEVEGKQAYGTLKNESGVHRLVRISPFNAKQQRHTSFSMVEVVPKLEKLEEINLKPDEVQVEFAKAGGPGGQNVNKRETAVRATHIPTGLTVHVTSERSQAQNKERALQMLTGKLYKKLEEERIAKEKGMQISKTTDIEWGNQIRSYVLHPYKMVKDHRTEVELRVTDKVLDGDIDEFIEAEKGL